MKSTRKPDCRRGFLPTPPVNVAAVRRATRMSQVAFARRFGFPVATLRHWEHGGRKPRGAALVLLNVIAKYPGVVDAALRSRHRIWWESRKAPPHSGNFEKADPPEHNLQSIAR
jgi:DNA-binding transcriptional regulator YiaG